MSELKVNLMYPLSEDYDYETMLQRINLDDERMNDINTDNGFIISDPNGIKKDIKDPNGMFSSKYGQTLKDMNPYATRYKCECGHVMFKVNEGTRCPICEKEVKFVDDNFNYFGWKVLKDYYFIHPNLYKSLRTVIGKTQLDNILNYEVKKDEDGHIIEDIERPKKEPFYGIGMIAFHDRFDEIMEYYGKSSANTSNKKQYYDDIMENKDKIFAQSIPYFTLLLRPVNDEQSNFYFEDSNSFYYMMNKLAAKINNYDHNDPMCDLTSLNKLLYDLQCKYNKLYENIEKTIEKKKGNVRQLLSGRYNFSSRCVITANLDLRIDEITLPYSCLVEILQQRIINILRRTYSINYSDARDIWYKATLKPDKRVKDIINSIIKSSGDGRGIPFIINRNPTIAYGGYLQMFCVGMNDSYTMEIPLRVLRLLAADFDGDILNIMLIINDRFFERANQVFNPANAMQVSRNDGKFNNQVNHQRDTIINFNTLIHLGRSNYSPAELEQIKAVKNAW